MHPPRSMPSTFRSWRVSRHCQASRPLQRPPVRGRGFTVADRASSVAIVNETMARLLWPGDNAIGKCFVLGDAKTCTEVIGVVPDARRFSAVEDASMMLYIPFSDDWNGFITALVVRAH